MQPRCVASRTAQTAIDADGGSRTTKGRSQPTLSIGNLERVITAAGYAPELESTEVR